MQIDPRVVSVAGPGRAIYIARVLERLTADSTRGAAATRYADSLAAQDTGLSANQVRRYREWWADIGVLVCRIRGTPPTVEYDVTTLDRWQAWYEAQFGTSAKSIRHQRQINSAPAPNQFGTSANTDLDDDIEREIAHIARQNGWSDEQWQAEARAIRARCEQRAGVRDIHAYTRAALIAAASAPPRQPRQQQQRPRPRSHLRPQVTYTDEEREQARQRARERIAARRAATTMEEICTPQQLEK